jgi:hypothetical protein
MNEQFAIDCWRGKWTEMKTALSLGAVVVLCCAPCLAENQKADERLRAIYTEEWKWRLEQFLSLVAQASCLWGQRASCPLFCSTTDR